MSIYTWVAHEADCDRCDRKLVGEDGWPTMFPNLGELLEALTRAGWVADTIPGRVRCKSCVDDAKVNKIKGAVTSS